MVSSVIWLTFINYEEANLKNVGPLVFVGFKTACAGILRQSISVRCAVLKSSQKGETAV